MPLPLHCPEQRISGACLGSSLVLHLASEAWSLDVLVPQLPSLAQDLQEKSEQLQFIGNYCSPMPDARNFTHTIAHFTDRLNLQAGKLKLGTQTNTLTYYTT